jgi:hypothetical protein
MGRRKLVTGHDGWSSFLPAWSLKISHISRGSLSRSTRIHTRQHTHTRYHNHTQKHNITRYHTSNKPPKTYKLRNPTPNTSTHLILPSFPTNSLPMNSHEPFLLPYKTTTQHDPRGDQKCPSNHNHLRSSLPYPIPHRLHGRLQPTHTSLMPYCYRSSLNHHQLGKLLSWLHLPPNPSHTHWEGRCLYCFVKPLSPPR